LNPYELIILVSITLILSYVSSLIYEKTKIPDIVWLIFLGILVGPVLNIFNKKVFVSLSHLMSIIALSVILFDAGLDINIKTLLKQMGKASVLSITTIISVILVVGVFLSRLLPNSFNLLEGMLLGSMIAGTSTVSVFGILSQLSKNIDDIGNTQTMLMIESVLSDPICIMLSIMFIRMVMEPDTSILISLRKLVIVLVFSSLLGVFSGMVWANILTPIRGRPYSYMVTLAVLLPLFAVAEKVIGKGGGAMVAITFGLALSNFDYFANLINFERDVLVPLNDIREFHGEITFFVKSFFFVYIGLIVTLSLKYTLTGLGIVTLIMCVRYLVVTGISKAMSFTVEEEVLSKVVYASGLPAFVMSQLPLIYDPNAEYFSNPRLYPDLAMPIVLGIVIVNALAGSSLAKEKIEEENNTLENATEEE